MYQTGALPSKPDNRDYTACAIPRMFPEKFILDMDANYSQEYGTCVAQSMRGVFREHFGVEFGTAFLYGGGRSHDRAGMYPNEAANFACKHGLAPLAADPNELEVLGVIEYYKTNRERLEASASAYAGGKWGRAYDVGTVKAAVLDGLPVLVCAQIQQWNPDEYHRFPCKKNVYGAHEMLIIGWQKVNGEDMAVVYNSWGKKWGNKGTCYMWWDDVFALNDVIVLTPPEADGNEENNVVVRRTLKKGMEGADVKELQTLLIRCGFRCDMGEPDGVFGSKTDAAVRAYQKSRDLSVDGVVGPNTWASLDLEEPDDNEDAGFIPTGLMAEFIKYLIVQHSNRCIYVWGAQGETEITEAWIRRMETSTSNANRAIAYWKEQLNNGYGGVLRAFDCSGLGMYFIQNLHGLYSKDSTADGMRSFCKEIERSELRAGDWVFRLNSNGKATHIGYVIDNDKRIIHARGRDHGVVCEYLNDNGATYWNGYGRPTIFDTKKRDLKLEIPYLRGEDVRDLQDVLQFLGYNITPDGVYGTATDAALRSFQDRAKRMASGVCDAAMRELLGL